MPHTLPLAAAGAQYSHDGGKTWKTVLTSYLAHPRSPLLIRYRPA